jgi:hypothetical protein
VERRVGEKVLTLGTQLGWIDLASKYFGSDGELTGTLLGKKAVAATWRGTLMKPNGDHKSFDLRVNGEGSFRARIPEAADFALSSGLQLRLEYNDAIARGWVHVEDILWMPRLPRSNIPAFLRIIAREETEDDEIALLEYLAINARKHLPSFSRRIVAGTKSNATGNATSEVVLVDIEDIAPTATPNITPGSGAHALSLSKISLDRVFTQLRRRLLGHGERKPHVGSSVTTRVKVEVDEQGDDTSAESGQRFDDALFQFNHDMRGLLGSGEIEKLEIRGLYVLWFEVTMNMLLVKRGDSPEATRFMKEWLAQVVRASPADEDIDSLEQHVVTSAATLEITQRGSVESDTATEAHEQLESFYGENVNDVRLALAVLPTLTIPFSILVPTAGEQDLMQSLQRILETVTIRQHVLNLIADCKAGKPIDRSLPIFRGNAGQTVLTQLQSERCVPRFVEQADNYLACPKCFRRFETVMERQLIDHRIALSSCGWFMVRTKI